MIVRERILALDLLRGVALAGILVMNIQSFSMPSAAYINPTAYGDLTAWNKWIWIISHIVAKGKFMSIFSILFGAGVLIFIENAISRGDHAARLHFSRMGWLLLFGMIHGYLLWSGDILVCYSLCGMIIWFFRNRSAERLLRSAFIFFLIPMLLGILWAFTMPFWDAEAVESMLETWSPEAKSISLTVERMRGGWLEQMKVRVPHTISMQTTVFVAETAWRVISMMLLGMFLLKREVLTAKRSRSFYIRMTLIGLFPGYLLSAIGVWMNFHKGWTLEYSMFLGVQFNYMGSLMVALGYIGLLMLIIKSDRCQVFISAFSALGRTAFSNYIFQTLICTFIFYGTGFGLFGSVERKYHLLIVLGIWILQILLSTLYLKRFRQGPLEWLWRRLSYRQ